MGNLLDLPVSELAKRLSDDPISLAIAFEEIADTCKSGHPIQVRYTVPELLLNLKLAVIRAKADSAILATYQTDLSEDPTTPSLDKGIQLLTRLNTHPQQITEWADSCGDYAISWREFIEYQSLKAAAERDFVESDYAEPILKSDLAFMFDVDRATIARRIQSGELRTMPGTSHAAKKVRIHGDDFPTGLTRPNERKQKLSLLPKLEKRQ